MSERTKSLGNRLNLKYWLSRIEIHRKLKVLAATLQKEGLSLLQHLFTSLPLDLLAGWITALGEKQICNFYAKSVLSANNYIRLVCVRNFAFRQRIIPSKLFKEILFNPRITWTPHT